MVLKKGELVIGIIGRLVPIKNHDMFLEVVSIVKSEKNKNKNVRFAIIGDGESRIQIEERAKALNISCSYFITSPKVDTDVVITSWETEIDQALAGLDIVVLTSSNEGTPVSLIEAQAAFRPVVSTNVGGVEDIVVQGKTGYITDVNDIGAFAKYVQLLIDDENLREEMGKRGYDNVITSYSKQRLISDMKNLYLGFLEKRKIKEPAL